MCANVARLDPIYADPTGEPLAAATRVQLMVQARCSRSGRIRCESPGLKAEGQLEVGNLCDAVLIGTSDSQFSDGNP